MFNVRLHGNPLYGKSLAVAVDVFGDSYFVLSFFPRDVLDEIWD